MATAAVVLLATYLIGSVARWDVAAFSGLGNLQDHEVVWSITHRVTRPSDPLPTVLMLAIVCAAGFAWGRPRHAVGALLLVAGGAIAGTILKALLAHPRYGSLLGSEQLPVDAYPSGHAIAAMSLGLAAVLVTPKRWRAWSAIGAAAYALAVGTSLVINGCTTRATYRRLPSPPAAADRPGRDSDYRAAPGIEREGRRSRRRWPGSRPGRHTLALLALTLSGPGGHLICRGSHECGGRS